MLLKIKIRDAQNINLWRKISAFVEQNKESFTRREVKEYIMEHYGNLNLHKYMTKDIERKAWV